MKLIVQIPCLDEEATLPETVADIPREIPGFDSVEVLIVDDGSTDRTVEVAKSCGVDHIVRHPRNRGLARAYQTGLDACLRLGADVIVNTDGDHQYCGADIPSLVRPIVEQRADFVLGDRNPAKNPEFSWLKRRLQVFGSMVVRRMSGVDVPDAVTGFRAISREVASDLLVLSDFSYTIETLVQAGYQHYRVVSVPVRTYPKTRPSRLFRNIPSFLFRSGGTLLRVCLAYSPLRFFLIPSFLLGLLGVVPIVRFLYLFAIGEGQGHIQSLVLGGVCFLSAILFLAIGMLADLLSWNRRLMERILLQLRRMELSRPSTHRHVEEVSEEDLHRSVSGGEATIWLAPHFENREATASAQGRSADFSGTFRRRK